MLTYDASDRIPVYGFDLSTFLGSRSFQLVIVAAEAILAVSLLDSKQVASSESRYVCQYW